MKKVQFLGGAILLLAAAIFSCSLFNNAEPVTTGLRAPAYPLITIDPYTSAWSATDNVFDSPVRHWTGKTHSLIGALRVDGQTYRFLGKESIPLKVLVPLAIDDPWEGKVTFEAPRAGWEKPGFQDGTWTTTPAAFGSPGSMAMNTKWTEGSIWVRRTFATPVVSEGADLYLVFSHDDDCEIYLNGTEVVKTGDRARAAIIRKIDKSLLAADGHNVLAARCENRRGLAYLDFGLYTDPDRGEVFTQMAVQDRVGLSATSTLYEFTCGPVGLKLRFVSPLLPEDLDLLSRPVNFINYEVVSKDGAEHQVEIYFETTPEWAVNDVSQEVEVTHGETGGVGFVKAGTTEQPVLQRKGDNVRIDWGYVYLAAPETENVTLASGDYYETKTAFMQNGSVEPGEERVVAKMAKKMPVMAVINKIGSVAAKPASGFVMIAYDDIESIQYFGKNLKAWWKKDGVVTIDDALVLAANGHKSLMNRCATFDNELWKETLETGGRKYADLCVLAFRQSIAAHKLVKDSAGNILFLSKENFSNGSIGTVDVTYPSAPLYLRYNPGLLKGMLNPIFYYSESGKWTKPFAAHDVGTYPKANGQTYGADMPVEESGNMLVLTMAIAHQEGNAKYAEQHWEVLTTWADYLLENGLDPENQLCTDDFAGHFAHNANLSVKAIMGIASYGKLAEMLGKKEIAEKYTTQAKEMAKKWMEMANDGDHYRLTFDQPGTWSQKYNLVWDKLLGLGIFPPEVAQTEVAYYLTKQNEFGLPLDNRRTYTKSDWIVWTATLANDTATFNRFIDPLHRYVTETPDRVPMSDWYETTNAKQVGFQARSVVGGYFIKLLDKNR